MSGPYLDDLIATMNIRNKYAYVMRLVSDKRWYFFDMKTDALPHPIMWTPYVESAFWFPDEQAIEEFKADFIIPRQVEILRINRTGR